MKVLGCIVVFAASLHAAGAVDFAAVLGQGTVVSAMALDREGNLHLTGRTRSPGLPATANAFQKEFHQGSCLGGGFFSLRPCEDAFAAKLDPSGTRLIYATYLGASGDDAGAVIAVDALGNAYIAGTAGPGFPSTSGADQGAGPYGRPFIAKLNRDGSALIYSVFLDDGRNLSGVAAIALDSAGGSMRLAPPNRPASRRRPARSSARSRARATPSSPGLTRPVGLCCTRHWSGARCGSRAPAWPLTALATSTLPAARNRGISR